MTIDQSSRARTPRAALSFSFSPLVFRPFSRAIATPPVTPLALPGFARRSRCASAALLAFAACAAFCASAAPARAQSDAHTQAPSHASPATRDAHAQTQTKTQAKTQTTDPVLPPIEVFARALTNPFMSVTDPKTPHQPLPASDGADYLKTVPGFAAIRSGGANGDLVLRGMFGSRLNLLTDGAPTLGACPNRMDAPSSYVAPESYDKVTVVKGPQTVLYGPGASAGTVLFERVTPRFDAPGVRADASMVGGSYGRNDQNLELSTGTPDVYARVNANRSHEDDYRDGNGQRVPSAWNKWNANVALGATPDADTRVELAAGASDGDARYAGRGMDGVRFKRDSVQLHFDKKNLGKVLKRVEAEVFYSEADHRMDNYTLRPVAPVMGMSMGMSMGTPMSSDVRRRTAGARVAATFDLGEKLQWVAGMDAQSNWLYTRSAMGLQSPSALPWNATATMADLGLFSELTWNLNDAQRVVAGARLDGANARDDRATASGSMGGSIGGSMSSAMNMGKMPTPNPTANDTRTRVLPSGFVRYEQTASALPLTWYAGLGHTERFPDYWELFSPTRGPEGTINAFTGVQPEKTTQLDLGTRYHSHALDAWVSAYAGYVNDFILFDYGAGMNGAKFTQASNVNAQIMGGELGVSWRPAAGWKLGMASAYAWGRNAASGAPLPQIPPLDVRLSADYRWRDWALGGIWRIVAPQRRYALHEGNVVGQDFGPSAGFGVVSLHAQYDISKNAQLSIGIDNLFDKAYSEHLNLAGNAGFGYPGNTPVMEPGRTVWGRLRFRM